MDDGEKTSLSRRQKLRLLWAAIRTNSTLAAAVLTLSLLAAVLEGVGLGFMVPVIELATTEGQPPADGDRLVAYAAATYEFLGVPFSLGYILVGLTVVIGVRFGVQFLVMWLETVLEAEYVRGLRTRLFASVLEAHIEQIDECGSDELLNAVITQTEYHSAVLTRSVQFVQQLFLGAVYLGVALYLAPQLTAVALVAMGAITLVIHRVLKPAYTTGEAVAAANVRIQRAAQAGIQGARDVRVFTMRQRIADAFTDAIDAHTRSYVSLYRNHSLLTAGYLFASATTVFALTYVSVEVYALSVGSFAVFLFTLFRLAPLVGSLNSTAYGIDGELPHLVETERLMQRLEGERERVDAEASAPARIDRIDFENVTFAYPDDTVALCDISLSLERGETVAFVGQSGAGKSTVVSLLTALYDPSEGRVLANGRDVTTFDVDSWRARVAVVRQEPFLFNETLRYNITVGNPHVTHEALEEVCDVAQVTEFLPLLPNGLETVVGDDGVRLSGGQRQRVALARALLRDADVLVLDEATSDLDAPLERAVYDALRSRRRDRITILIGHRLSALTDVDRIYVIDHGEVVEVGSHGDLVSDKGTYAALFAAHTPV